MEHPEHVMLVYGAFVVAGRSYRSGPQNVPDAIVVTLSYSASGRCCPT